MIRDHVSSMLKAISALHLYVKYVPVYIKERDYLPWFLGGNECLEPLHPILKNIWYHTLNILPKKSNYIHFYL